MPIDPSLILGIRQPNFQVQDPLETYGKSLALKNLMATEELQGVQLEGAKRGMADEEAVRGAYRAAGGDSARLRALLGQGGQYKALQALDKFDLEKREKEANIGKSTAQGNKANIDATIAQIERGSSILSTARDQPSWDNARRVMSLNFPQLAAQLPEQFDPQFVRAKIAAGQTMAQRLTDERAREQQAETGRHNRASEQTARGQLGVAQGNLGLSRERLDFERNQPRGTYDADRGVMVDPRTGVATPVTAGGQPLGPKEKSTDTERVSAGYASRMAQSDKILTELEKKNIGKPEWGETIASAGIGGLGKVAANAARSPERQQYRQAQEDWVRAKLRKESGAVIGDEEMDREIRVYFPQHFDNPAVVTQKAQSRKVAERAMVQAAGRAPVETGSAAPGAVPPPPPGFKADKP